MPKSLSCQAVRDFYSPLQGALPLMRMGTLLEPPTARYYFVDKVMEAAMESTITVKGQATIPKAIREHLGLKAGDRIKFFVHPDGTVVLLPKVPVSALRGIVKTRRRQPVTIDQMNEAIAAGASEIRRRRRTR
jgi:AbrB family looped-hinge helix DNA binding protein